jgi:hypothetical protein
MSESDLETSCFARHARALQYSTSIVHESNFQSTYKWHPPHNCSASQRRVLVRVQNGERYAAGGGVGESELQKLRNY